MALFCLIVFAAQIVLSFDYEIKRSLQTGKTEGLRMAISEPYVASHEILSIQRHQKTHDELGFMWNLTYAPNFCAQSEKHL